MTPEKEIEDAIAGFVKAYNSGDLDGMLACYGDDLIKVRQGASPETKAEVASRVAVVFAKFLTQVDVTVDEILVSGNSAFTRGSFTVTLKPKAGGELLSIARRYLEIWRREDGRWLVVRTMDNSA